MKHTADTAIRRPRITRGRSILNDYSTRIPREPVTIAPDEILNPKRRGGRPSNERDDAVRWLRMALAAGPRPSADVEEEATGHGIRLVTLRRAFRSLGGEAFRVGYGPLGQWHWRLPSDDKIEPPSFDHL